MTRPDPTVLVEHLVIEIQRQAMELGASVAALIGVLDAAIHSQVVDLPPLGTIGAHLDLAHRQVLLALDASKRVGG